MNPGSFYFIKEDYFKDFNDKKLSLIVKWNWTK